MLVFFYRVEQVGAALGPQLKLLLRFVGQQGGFPTWEGLHNSAPL